MFRFDFLQFHRLLRLVAVSVPVRALSEQYGPIPKKILCNPLMSNILKPIRSKMKKMVHFGESQGPPRKIDMIECCGGERQVSESQARR